MPFKLAFCPEYESPLDRSKTQTALRDAFHSLLVLSFHRRFPGSGLRDGWQRPGHSWNCMWNLHPPTRRGTNGAGPAASGLVCSCSLGSNSICGSSLFQGPFFSESTASSGGKRMQSLSPGALNPPPVSNLLPPKQGNSNNEREGLRPIETLV